MPVRALLLLVAALALCAVTPWSLIVPGPSAWAISQPQSWQGGAEAALLLALLALLQGVSAQRWRLPARLEDFPTIALSSTGIRRRPRRGTAPYETFSH